MKLIIEGQKEVLDVSLYANPSYNIDKMRTIVAYLKNGIDPINFYGNKFCDKQCSNEIDKLKEHGIQKITSYVKQLDINSQNKNN